MEFTTQQIAHILAALRYTQDPEHDISAMEHFEDETPLTNEEINNLCETISCDPSSDDYTVVGLYPDHMWNGSMRDSSFVVWVSSEGPIEAAREARLQIARNHAVDEAEEFADAVEILAVVPGRLSDLYDPAQDKEKSHE